MKNLSSYRFNHLLTLAFFFILLMDSLPATAQNNQKDTMRYTVDGYRHGVSVFKQHHFPEVQYKAGEELLWNQYHTADVMYIWLNRWAEKYPDIFDLYEVGKSYEGRPIMQVTLTNKKTGKDTDKPAAYFEGGRHSGEVTSSESALWLIKHLLENYGKDQEITKLLDQKTIYVRVQNNPDGSKLYLNTAMRNRSTVKPYDSDRDGLLDEDDADDLDGDGVIYTMRWIDPDKGNMVSDPRDPSGIMMARKEKGKGIFQTASEGIDNDGDGERNEDGIGGLDLHRNYPENWRPDSGLDETGRGYTQSGAGEFPLSEPETRAVFTFLMTHPNISVINSMDTRVPMHLRGPSVDFSENIMFPEDLALFNHFDSLGMQITGYPWAGDTYNTYNTRYPVSQWSGDSTRPSPLFGHGPDFGYSYYGSIWYGDEIWNGGRYKDYDGDGEIDEYDTYQWNLQENNGEQFKAWTHYMHPELGLVEIGGFHPKFFSQNPPPRHLEPWIRKQALFNLAMAKSLPTLEWVETKLKKMKSYGDSTDYRLTVSWINTGYLPTALRIADQIKIVKKDLVSVEVEKEFLKKNPDVIQIIDPFSRNKTREMAHLNGGKTGTTTFVIRAYTKEEVPLTISLTSTRGGVLSKDLRLK